MADMDAIRRGLAALLRTALPADEGHVSAYFRTVPPTPCLQVIGPDGPDAMTATDFGDGRDFQIAIEACLSLDNEISAQMKLDTLIDAVAIAVESDNSPAGSLFSRWQDDNTILTGQDPAADSVAFVRYRGASPFRTEANTKLLTATWLIEVLA